MASDVTSPEPSGAELVPLGAAEAPAPRETAARRAELPSRRPPTPHWFRFLAIYWVLGAVVFAAIAGLALAIRHSGSTPQAAAWSSWRPTGAGLGQEEQIASRVGGEYRLPNGNQLVDVIAKKPVVTANSQTIPLGYVAIRGVHGNADRVYTISPSDTVMYTLCGLGTSCKIATGKPTVARGRLVRREILELALYTFRYVGAIHNVIAIMPPRSASATSVVVFLQRQDLSTELGVPLRKTLAAKTPNVLGMSPTDQTVVDETTSTRSYTFTLTRAQDGNAILILSHLAA